MAELIERREYTPKRFYAGEFPAVPETGTAGGAIALHDLVMSSDAGIVKATTEGIENVVGIAVSTAEAAGDPVVYIMTGEVLRIPWALTGLTRRRQRRRAGNCLFS